MIKKGLILLMCMALLLTPCLDTEAHNAVQDASEMGIPTISDQETQRLIEMYGR